MKKLRGNQAKFMTKELRKVFMDRSRLENKYLKYFLNLRNILKLGLDRNADASYA